MSFFQSGLPLFSFDCRWVKNLNQGTDGAEVDDLLQLSYLQRLARQKVAEMEVGTLSLLHMAKPNSFC